MTYVGKGPCTLIALNMDQLIHQVKTLLAEMHLQAKNHKGNQAQIFTGTSNQVKSFIHTFLEGHKAQIITPVAPTIGDQEKQDMNSIKGTNNIKRQVNPKQKIVKAVGTMSKIIRQDLTMIKGFLKKAKGTISSTDMAMILTMKISTGISSRRQEGRHPRRRRSTKHMKRLKTLIFMTRIRNTITISSSLNQRLAHSRKTLLLQEMKSTKTMLSFGQHMIILRNKLMNR